MKIYERSMQALLSPAPRGFAARSRVLARLASLAQIGELARRLLVVCQLSHDVISGYEDLKCHWCILIRPYWLSQFKMIFFHVSSWMKLLEKGYPKMQIIRKHRGWVTYWVSFLLLGQKILHFQKKNTLLVLICYLWCFSHLKQKKHKRLITFCKERNDAYQGKISKNR